MIYIFFSFRPCSVSLHLSLSCFLVRAIICNTSFLSWVGWEKNFSRARKNCFISNPCCWKNKVFRGFKVQSSPKVLGFLLHLSLCSHIMYTCCNCLLAVYAEIWNPIHQRNCCKGNEIRNFCENMSSLRMKKDRKTFPVWRETKSSKAYM